MLQPIQSIPKLGCSLGELLGLRLQFLSICFEIFRCLGDLVT
jgi:hypothetical protein